MSSVRAFASPVARAAFRPQIAGKAGNMRAFATSRIIRAAALTEAITSDHRELEKLYNVIVNSKDVEQQTRYGNQFIWELARHSVAEELIVYPAMEGMGEEGKAHAERDRKHHHTLKELLKTFQNMSAQDSEYVPQLKKLYKHLENHIKEEEKDDLPALEQALTSEKNRGSSESLAKSFSRTKMFVPSRSHPAAGENPYIEGPAGLPVAIFDHIADLFRKFPDGTISPNPSQK
ncbi:uncharacterized protein EKO05_0001150 [Ascochyta rabiei]|uniref:Uncharacterized protein n=1 Tax=Didymella rabiei TaxID=5454 RepID=A0A163LUJ6_DIDRA|nr:uncharacterized protein EKO05_0001150 [Ascochyta rabiei]KZM28134.1 hypothetical protein ST47_g721 [Ascochyta rabiei]UPX10492.1 hypothetical protein EKO05_0001150 [Ascochyta rabiei]